jgi:hypothetical protein
MTDSLPILMNELLPVAPENQKVSLSRLDCDNLTRLFSSNLPCNRHRNLYIFAYTYYLGQDF